MTGLQGAQSCLDFGQLKLSEPSRHGACISWRTSLAARAMLLRRLGYISAAQRCGWR
jgi:hypothetical protein